MREITLTVRGDTVHASRHRAGVQGEANATALVVAFDESWDGYAKKITFWDALGQNPVERTLTANLLVNAAKDTRTYKTSIPGEPLALAGECLLVIDGYVDGARARSMSVRLTVEEAPMADNAGEPADPTPTQAEQLQVQIEAIMEDIGKAAAGAQAAETAVKAAERAEGYSTHPPIIGENGNWWVWDGTVYVDSGNPPQGGNPSQGREIRDITFDNTSGRWVVAYADGTSETFAGYDPADNTVWSMFREDFSKYESGENGFGLPGDERQDWRFSDAYVTGVGYDIAEDGNGKYALLKCDDGTFVDSDGKEQKNRAAITMEPEIQGEYILEFDYMPTYTGSVSPGTTTTDFFEIWLFGTADKRFRARVNCKGISSINVDKDSADFDSSEAIKNASGNHYPFTRSVWYRVKIYVNVGQITMKIWERDAEVEPEGDSGAGITTLKAALFSEEYLAVPHEIRFSFGPMLTDTYTGDVWQMGFDNVRIYRLNEGKQGEQGLSGRGIDSITFNDATGRWVIAYTDGTADSFDGYDPVKSSIWSILRENFNSYTAGENTFTTEATDTWIMNPYHVKEAYRDVEEDSDGGKYVVFRTTGSSTRVHTTRKQEFCGEYCVEFDYMSLTNGGSVTDFFEVWLLATPKGTTKIDGPIRARVNIKGRHSIHVNRNYTTSVSDKYMANYPLASNTWYRVKISVKVGKISMKIWKRGDTEPTEGAAGTVVLDSTVVTEELVACPRQLEFVFGSMGVTPPAGGYRMGFDNVRVYRDIADSVSGGNDSNHSGCATTETYNVTVTNEWTEVETTNLMYYYYQDISVPGMLATDNPFPGVAYGEDNDANVMYDECFVKVLHITASADSVRVWATEAIDTAFPLQLKVVR